MILTGCRCRRRLCTRCRRGSACRGTAKPSAQELTRRNLWLRSMVKPGAIIGEAKRARGGLVGARRGGEGKEGQGRIRARTDGPEDGVRPVRAEADVAEGLVERHHPRGLFAPRVIPAAPSRARAHHFPPPRSPSLAPARRLLFPPLPLLSLPRTDASSS